MTTFPRADAHRRAAAEAALTPMQIAVADRVVREEDAMRRHLVIALSGAHAYGFPSPDSDLDLKSVHVAPTEQMLGLRAIASKTRDRLEVLDGVEVDYSSNELGAVLGGVLSGNGNFLERLCGPMALLVRPEVTTLGELVMRTLSRRVHGHYRGFAQSQLKRFDEAPEATAKKALYVLRTALTGIHLLRERLLKTDVRPLLSHYGFEEARSLVETKRRGERVVLSPEARDGCRHLLERALTMLDAARDDSPLPEAPEHTEALEAWLVDYRVSLLGGRGVTG